MRECSKCGVGKSQSDFYPRTAACKKCVIAQVKQYRLGNLDAVNRRQLKHRKKNRAKAREVSRIWRANNAERSRAAVRSYHLRHTEWHRENSRAWAKANPARVRKNDRLRYKNSLNFKLTKNLRNRIRSALTKGVGKSKTTIALLGCSIDDFKKHLESLFKPGMTWKNHGPVWHIDHKRPCASFDLSNPAQQAVCFHYTNTQPLFALDNIRKRAKIL